MSCSFLAPTDRLRPVPVVLAVADHHERALILALDRIESHWHHPTSGEIVVLGSAPGGHGKDDDSAGRLAALVNARLAHDSVRVLRPRATWSLRTHRRARDAWTDVKIQGGLSRFDRLSIPRAVHDA